MYNKTKYLTGKIGGILAIILGGLIVFGEMFNIVVMNKFDHNIGYRFFLLLLIRLIIRFVLGGIFISYGLATVRRPVLYTSKSPAISFWIDTDKKKTLTLIVLSGILLILGLLSIPFHSFGDIFDLYINCFIFNIDIKIDVLLSNVGTWLHTFISFGRMTLNTFLPFGNGFRIDIVTQWIIQTPLCLIILILKTASLCISNCSTQANVQQLITKN